ncbi:hypothetical protein L9F63_007661, partial [Diploptera punctata]
MMVSLDALYYPHTYYILSDFDLELSFGVAFENICDLPRSFPLFAHVTSDVGMIFPFLLCYFGVQVIFFSESLAKMPILRKTYGAVNEQDIWSMVSTVSLINFFFDLVMLTIVIICIAIVNQKLHQL